MPSEVACLNLLQQEGVAEGDHWLALAGGSPVLALELVKAGQSDWLTGLLRCLGAGSKGDPLANAAEVDKLLKDSKGKLGLRQVVDWLQKWVIDLLLAKRNLPARYFLRQQATITALVGETSPEALLRYYRQLAGWRREVEQPLNGRLFLESLFLDYRILFAQR